MPSMLMATLQGLVSSILLYAAFCAPVAAYALLRVGSGEMAWFTAVAFFLMSLYVTQVCVRLDGWGGVGGWGLRGWGVEGVE